MPQIQLYDDKELCRRIAVGDEQAFQTLFRLHRDRLFAFAVRFTKSAAAAEDIIQDVFLKLWEQPDLLEKAENPPAYIFILVRNKTLDYLRKISNDQRLQQEVWLFIAHAQRQAEDTFEKVDAKETEQLINEAVQQLPPQQQKIFILSRTKGLSHEQIAEQLGISKNTVKNHLIAALGTIRKYLNKRHAVDIYFLIMAFFIN